MTGFSMELKDKSVDRILAENQILGNKVIYYSPIKTWIFFWCMLFFVLMPFSLLFLSVKYLLPYIKYVALSVLLYFSFGYFIISILNHSFAISNGQLLIINSHFPFSKFQRFSLKQIAEIKISSTRKLAFLNLFGLFSMNYVEVYISDKRKRFYCLFLDFDCYDENWTEKTLDELSDHLEKEGVVVNLDYR